MSDTSVTIICDASFCPVTGAGGWAARASGSLGKRNFAASFKSVSKSPELAEMQAIVNALHTAINAGIVCPGFKVLIQTDCKGAITKFSNPTTYTELDYTTDTNLYCSILRRFCLTVSFKHVKAHVAIKDVRTWVQDWCDENAKSHMRRMRRKLKEEGKQREAILGRSA